MDYKEKYEKAYKLLEQMHDGGIVSNIDIENAFPELKEKSVINMLKIAVTNTAWLDCDKNQCLSWLEKQGKRNSADSYCQENCKGFQETGKCFADGECKAKRDAEQNSAWSEEDEKIMKQIDSLLYCQCTIHSSMYEKLHNWLKSLKPQPHWKPTEQQMNALKQTSENYYVMYNTILKSLYNDLKKL